MTTQRRSSGFTLIEIMIVLAIAALIMSLGVKGLRSLARADLRAGATHLAGSIRFMFDRASTTGKMHRMVFDFDSNKYWEEVSDDKYYAPRETETPEAARKREAAEAQEDQERREAEEKAAAAADTSSTSTPSSSTYDATKLDYGAFKPRRARFAAFKGLSPKSTVLKNTVLRSVYTPRLSEPVTSGRAYLYFFPLGQTEPAIVTLSDRSGETIYSLVVHPITGRVKVYNEEVKPPPGERTDDEGKTVEP
jgi:general secretion pathway protein H